MSRRFVRWGGPLLIALAGAAFWILTHGGVSSSVQMMGFAEAIDHPVAPVASGRLAQLKVTLGQSVKAGDVLAVLDTRELELRRDAARSDLLAAQAQLAAAEISQRAAVVRAELLVLRLRTQESKDRAQLAQLHQQLDRLGKLADQQLVQAQDVEARRLQQAGLKATVGVLSDAAQKKLAGLGRAMPKGSTDAQVAVRLKPYEEAVHAREVALKAAELALEQATLRSHVDGVVSMLVHHAGDVVSAGSEVVRVTDGRPGRVVVWVPERLALRASAGSAAEVRRQALFTTRIEGRIVEASPEIEEVPLRSRPSPGVPAWGRRIVIECPPDSRFLLGEALHVRL